jgi:hypothetical protein
VETPPTVIETPEVDVVVAVMMTSEMLFPTTIVYPAVESTNAGIIVRVAPAEVVMVNPESELKVVREPQTVLCAGSGHVRLPVKPLTDIVVPEVVQGRT